MNRTKWFVLAAGLAILALSALPLGGTARASAPVPPVTFIYERLGTIDAGRTWFDADGMHIRDRVDFGLLTGSIEGSAWVVYNADLGLNEIGPPLKPVPMPDDGTAYGTIKFFAAEPDAAVSSWSGVWSYQLQDGKVVSGELTAANVDRSKILVVTAVTQGRAGIIHTGYFENPICLSDICEAPASP